MNNINNYSIHCMGYTCPQISTKQLQAGFTGTFHSVTVSSVGK